MSELPGFLDLLSPRPDYSANPDERLHALRSRCPVHFDPVSRHLLVSSHVEARRLLHDPSLLRHPVNADPQSVFARFIDRRPIDPSLPPGERSSILLLDQPDHRRIRVPLQRAFHARVFKARPLIERVVDAHLAALAGADRFDLVAALTIPIPIHAIAAILGVAADRLENFRGWSEDLILTLNPFRSEEEDQRAIAATEALHGHFREMLERRRRQPADDLVSDFAALQAEGAPLSDRELLINLTALLVGGNLTTTDLMASGVKLFLENPREKERLMADPSLAASAVEEVLRMEAPVDFTPRVAPCPMTVGGEPVAAKTPIFALLRAANRDPAIFADPDRFDIGRQDGAHLAFGGGAHICIGAALARLEARIFFPRFFAAFPGARLAPQEYRYRPLPGFRGLEELWVET
ncbi:cytochrome P450 [Thermaurantiacus sp.]